ncbi:MAG: primosomal protein N' [bacterium]|nr:primosomal protein N' [bacterium]
MKRYINLSLRIPTTRLYTYSVPEHIKKNLIGKRVLVLLKQKKAVGWVIEEIDRPDNLEIKEIITVLDDEPIISPQSINLAKWTAEYYLCGLSEALNLFIPPSLSQKPITYIEKGSIEITKASPTQKLILELVKEKGRVSLSTLKSRVPSPYSCIKKLSAKGAIKVISQVKPLPEIPKEIKAKEVAKDIPPVLSPDQKEAIDKIRLCIEKGSFSTFLLYGVTGSGKTEVYLRAIEDVIKRGRSAIVLLPEISLTTQLIERFKMRFGAECAIIHSRLTTKERLTEWQRIRQGCPVVVGARSALFSPSKNLGLIVVDEEQSSSYKQENDPRYNARDTAVMRAKMEKAVVILGSATPSLESFHNSQIRRYERLDLPERVQKSRLPDVEIVDMRSEKTPGIFSQKLIKAIEETVGSGHQVILLMNRRGFSNYIQCYDCGSIPGCPNCDITLTFHSSDKRLRCHYCGFSSSAPSVCPKCNAERIKYSGFGTQQVEKEVLRIFPKMRVLRMDTDTTKKRLSHQEMLSLFAEKKVDCLVGTQMISKGLHFPNVILVGVISADIFLSLPDFRAAEKTFSLLTQVSGRSGRGEDYGRVVIQTYNPGHYAIQTAIHQDYSLFFQKEMEYRRELLYPPFSRLLSLILRGENEEKVEKEAERLSEVLLVNNKEDVHILGPAPYYISKIKKNYLYQVILKTPDYKRLHRLLLACDFKPASGVSLIKDIDPVGVV